MLNKSSQSDYTVSQKKLTNFETVYLEIIRIDFDDIWQKYSKYSRIEFVYFSFRVGLLFYQLFVFVGVTPAVTVHCFHSGVFFYCARLVLPR